MILFGWVITLFFIPTQMLCRNVTSYFYTSEHLHSDDGLAVIEHEGRSGF